MDREGMAKAERERAERMFSKEAVIGEYIGYYERILRGGDGAR